MLGRELKAFESRLERLRMRDLVPADLVEELGDRFVARSARLAREVDVQLLDLCVLVDDRSSNVVGVCADERRSLRQLREMLLQLDRSDAFEHRGEVGVAPSRACMANNL